MTGLSSHNLVQAGEVPGLWGRGLHRLNPQEAVYPQEQQDALGSLPVEIQSQQGQSLPKTRLTCWVPAHGLDRGWEGLCSKVWSLGVGKGMPPSLLGPHAHD